MSDQRALTMLNQLGEVTIVWDEEHDAEMEAIITEKMAHGVVFFIIEPRFFGLLPPKRTQLSDAAEALRHRALAVADEHLAAFVSSGAGATVKTPSTKVRGSRKSTNAKEVAASQSVGVRPARGG